MAKYLSGLTTSIFTNEFDTVQKIGLNYVILDTVDTTYRRRGTVSMAPISDPLAEAVRELVGLAQAQICALESISCSSSSSS